MNNRIRNLFCLAGLLCSNAVFAQSGGLTKVGGLVDKITGALTAISVGVVTIAIIWAGYKFLFKNADMRECLMIIGGGLLIGGAAELANFLLN